MREGSVCCSHAPKTPLTTTTTDQQGHQQLPRARPRAVKCGVEEAPAAAPRKPSHRWAFHPDAARVRCARWGSVCARSTATARSAAQRPATRRRKAEGVPPPTASRAARRQCKCEKPTGANKAATENPEPRFVGRVDAHLSYPWPRRQQLRMRSCHPSIFDEELRRGSRDARRHADRHRHSLARPDRGTSRTMWPCGSLPWIAPAIILSRHDPNS